MVSAKPTTDGRIRLCRTEPIDGPDGEPFDVTLTVAEALAICKDGLLKSVVNEARQAVRHEKQKEIATLREKARQLEQELNCNV